MPSVLRGLRGEALDISSRTALGVFHATFLTQAPFSRLSEPRPPPRPPCPRPIHLHLPRSHRSSVSSLARFSLCRLPFRQKGVCQVPNPLAKRSKADKETGDLLFYSRKAKKKWNPPSPGLCILPLLFHSLNPALVFFFPFCQTSSPPPSPLSLSKSTYGRMGGMRTEEVNE